MRPDQKKLPRLALRPCEDKLEGIDSCDPRQISADWPGAAENSSECIIATRSIPGF